MAKYHVGERSRTKLLEIIDKVDRSTRGEIPHKRRRGKSTRKSKPGTGDVVLALINEDIDGVVESDPPDEIIVTEGPPEEEVERKINRRNFKVSRIELPYFEVAPAEEYDLPEDVRYRLVTEVTQKPNDPLDPEAGTHDYTDYTKREFFWLDGQGISLDNYTRIEYEEYYGELDMEDPDFLSENDPFPPEGSQEGYWKRSYRIQAKPDSQGRYWLDFKTCKAVPPPPLSEAVLGS